MTNDETFPIDLRALRPLALNPSTPRLTDDQRRTLAHNTALCRDAIVLFTAVADAKGLGGHTGGAYDTVPEVVIARAFIAAGAPLLPVFFDEAGHRVATQYLLSVLDGDMPAGQLLHHREYNSNLPGHPERARTPGVKFSSGRLGHLWPYANGVALANPGKSVLLLGSDGSQQEGDDAEAARLAVSQKINIKLLIDDNDVTIAGAPSKYLPGYDVARTLAGHGLTVQTVDGENLDSLFAGMCLAFTTTGPFALIIKRKMAPGIAGLEGSCHAHDSIKLDKALAYLESRGQTAAVAYLKTIKPDKSPLTYKGSSGGSKNRDDFGKIINSILDSTTPEKRLASVRVFDCDLEGSCGLHHIRKKYPELYVSGGIMERGNFSAAAGFGYESGKQGIFGTFSAFLEMIVSELTMARLNQSNVLAHFSHAGCDDMADNTCHFGINNFFAANGLPDDGHDLTRLYFPADQYQFAACLKRIFPDPGCRFIFSTRSGLPDILDENGRPLFAHPSYAFVPGKDDIIREAPPGAGYIVAFGDTLHRALDAVLTLKDRNIPVGLINKPTLNLTDPDTMKRLSTAPFVLVVEGFNVNTGLGIRFGTELLKAGFKGRYTHLGTNREGCGGLWQQMGHQGLDPRSISRAVEKLL
jgi:transketolase